MKRMMIAMVFAVLLTLATVGIAAAQVAPASPACAGSGAIGLAIADPASDNRVACE